MKRQVQRGVALVEALVAVLIFSVGVLGVIGMQTLALKASTDGKYRADAAYLANQIIGMMWADSRANLTSYRHYCANTTVGCAPACPVAAGSAPASTNANVLAWVAQVTNQFPSGAALEQISVVPVLSTSSTQTLPTYQVAVSICWSVPHDAAGQYHNYVVAAQIS